MKMVEYSYRHRLINRMVMMSLGITSAFGLNCYLYSYTEHKLMSSIQSHEAMIALKNTALIDELRILPELNKEAIICNNSFPDDCKDYFERIIQIRNRSKDYKITLIETLYVDQDNSLLEALNSIKKITDLIANDIFEVPFKEAKRKGIGTSSQYISYASKKNVSSKDLIQINKRLIIETKSFFNKSKNWIQNEFSEMKSIESLYHQLNIFYLILVTAEIILFLLVAAIDLSLNNVSKVISEGEL